MHRGFSLVEIILSVAILGLVFMAVSNVFPTTMLSIREAQDRYQADNLTRSLINETRSRAFSSLVPGAPQPGEPYSAGGIEFRPKVQIRTVEGARSEDLVEIRVTVDWETRGKVRQAAQSLYVCALRR